MAAHMQKCFRLTSLFLRYDKSRPIRVEVTSSLQRRQLSKDVDDKSIPSSKPLSSEDGTEKQEATTNLDIGNLLQSQKSSEDAGSGAKEDGGFLAAFKNYTNADPGNPIIPEKADKSSPTLSEDGMVKQEATTNLDIDNSLQNQKSSEDAGSGIEADDGFLAAFKEYSKPEFVNPEIPEKKDEPFPTLFRKSKFVDLGNAKNRIINGRIFHIVEDDLYVDFGWKFHCVVQRPQKDGDMYVRNSIVRLRIKDLEMSARFLGSTKDLSLNEADCQLIGLVSSPLQRRNVASP